MTGLAVMLVSPRTHSIMYIIAAVFQGCCKSVSRFGKHMLMGGSVVTMMLCLLHYTLLLLKALLLSLSVERPLSLNMLLAVHKSLVSWQHKGLRSNGAGCLLRHSRINKQSWQSLSHTVATAAFYGSLP